MATNDNFNSLFDSVSDDDMNATASAIRVASDTESTGSRMIKWSGQFVMKASTAVYKKDDEIKVFPAVVKAQTGTIMLSLKLEVADEGDTLTKRGDSIYSNITLIMPNADEEKRKKIANITKPRLLAMTGTEVNFSKEWIRDNLTVDFDEKLKVTRDHKLKNLVLVTVQVKMDNEGKDKAEVTSIRPVNEMSETITDRKSYEEAMKAEEALKAARAGGSSAAVKDAPKSYGTAPTEGNADVGFGSSAPVEEDMPF